MTNEEYRRQMGMDMLGSGSGVSSERPKAAAKSDTPSPAIGPTYMIVGGVVMVQEEDGWRYATAEEIEQITGGVLCMPSGCCEEGDL